MSPVIIFGNHYTFSIPTTLWTLLKAWSVESRIFIANAFDSHHIRLDIYDINIKYRASAILLITANKSQINYIKKPPDTATGLYTCESFCVNLARYCMPTLRKMFSCIDVKMKCWNKAERSWYEPCHVSSELWCSRLLSSLNRHSDPHGDGSADYPCALCHTDSSTLHHKACQQAMP